MASTKNMENLFNAMLLIEIVNGMHRKIREDFSRYPNDALTWTAHDLIQHVYCNGETFLEARTLEIVAILDAVRDRIDQQPAPNK